MKKWRQRSTALAAFLLLVAAGCSSADSGDSSSAPDDDEVTGEVGTITDMDPNFETTSLPDDFPSELIPDSYTAGMYAELGSVRNINFETPGSFDDVVAEYTAKIGAEPILAQGEERLASWTVDTWVVSVIEDDPVVVGVATTE